MKTVLGQRGLVMALTAIVLLVFGAILGKPGEFPAVEAQTVFTPDYVFSLIGGVITPLFFLVRSFSALAQAISARVNNPDDKFGTDLKSLLKAKEFWVYVVTAGIGIGQIFGVKVLEEEQQIVIANGLMALSNYLLQSWGERPSGTIQDVQIVKLE